MLFFGQLAIMLAAGFTGAALYITTAEQPARLDLDDRALLTEWKTAYKRGSSMQASLAGLSFLLGLGAWWQTSEWRWLLGAGVLVTSWPYTLLVMKPTNSKLMAMDPASAGAEGRALVTAWGRLHAVRTDLGLMATVLFVWASLR